jgi:hypothetical protein
MSLGEGDIPLDRLDPYVMKEANSETDSGQTSLAGRAMARISDWFQQRDDPDDEPVPDDQSTDGDPPDSEPPDQEHVRLDPGDDPLLIDEERVMLELEKSGRTKQSELVSRMDWSKVKTSRLLSEMEEDDLVCRTRIGREKIVSLPDQQLEVARPPTESEGGASGLAYR